ncbi:MAG: type I secretion C-terminal target domain-containing protein, partial [Aeromonas veronii]
GSADGSAEAGKDYGSAVFSHGVTYNAATGQISVPAGVTSFTVSFPTIDDTIDEANETMTLTVGGKTATGTIVDNDDVPKVASIVGDTVVEGNANSFAVGLTNTASTPTTLTLTLASGTATKGVDFSGTQVAVTIGGVKQVVNVNANGNFNVTVPANTDSFSVKVSTVNDTVFEASENYTLSGAGTSSTVTGTATITDNDAPPTVVINKPAVVSEEGLANGLPDTTGNTDTTNATIASGTITVGDVDSSSVTVSLSGPSGLKSGGLDVKWNWDASGKMLTGYTGTLGGTDYKAVLDVKLTAPAGSTKGDWGYDVTLKGALDHPVTGAEDALSFNVGVSVSDGQSTTVGSLPITVEDDVPVAGPIFHAVESETKVGANVQLVLDVSGSMSFAAGNGKTRLAVMKESANQLLDQYLAQGQTRVQLVLFSSEARIVNQGTSGNPIYWMTVEQAKVWINGLTANGGTDYDDAIKWAENFWSGNSNARPLTGASNVSYFLSDGVPEGSDRGNPNTIEASELAAWTKHLQNNKLTALAYGMGNNVPAGELDKVAFDGYLNVDGNAVIVPDVTKLPPILLQSVVRPIGGNLLSGVEGYGVGADGGFVGQLTIRGVTYNFDGNTVTTTGSSSALSHSFDAATKTLTIYIDNKHSLIVDLDNGSYQFFGAAVSPSAKLDFGYTLKDLDGDTSASTLTFVVGYDIKSTGDMIDSVQMYDPTASNQKVQWLTSGTGTPINMTLQHVENGIVVDVGVGGDKVYLGEGNDIIYLGDSHVSGFDSNAQQKQDAAEQAVDNFSLGADSLLLQDPNNENSDLKITANSNAYLDIAHGGGGDDRIYGQNGSDVIFGGSGNDHLYGGDGKDALRGGSGSDVLDGGAGNDYLIGGLGNDILIGGEGADTFVWNKGDTVSGSLTKDYIMDFNKGSGTINRLEGDKLDLSDLLDHDGSHSTTDLKSLLSVFQDNEGVHLQVKESSTAPVTQEIVLMNHTFDSLTGGSGTTANQVIDYMLTNNMLDIDK